MILMFSQFQTDGFTIQADDLDKANNLLNFDNCLGSWRLSKTDDIIYPCCKLYVVQLQNFTSKKVKTTDMFG
ncbi:MAG: hypothetical protein ACKPKO_01885, partial [Candidatus Fonsibacter sp.]